MAVALDGQVLPLVCADTWTGFELWQPLFAKAGIAHEDVPTSPAS